MCIIQVQVDTLVVDITDRSGIRSTRLKEIPRIKATVEAAAGMTVRWRSQSETDAEFLCTQKNLFYRELCIYEAFRT